MLIKILPIFLICLFFLLYSSINILYFNDRVPISPDESQALFFSKLLAEKYTLIQYNPLNSHFTEQIFAARQYVQIGEKTMPSAFLGYIILLSLIRGINENLLNLSGPLLASFSLIFIYLLSKYFFNEKTALISVTLLGFFPAFLYWTVSFYNNLAELTFLLGGIYYMIRSIKDKRLIFYILTAIFFGLSIWMRYTNLLLIPITVIIYISVCKFRFSISKAMLASCVFILILIPIFISNKLLFGSPTNIGQYSKYQLVYELNLDQVPLEKIPLTPFRDFSILSLNAKNYLFEFAPILILSLLGFIYTRKKVKHNSEIIILVVIASIWSLYYLGGVYFGYNGPPTLNSSYTRYLLITYAILIIFFSYFLNNINNNKIKILLIIITIFGFINYSSNSSRGLIALSGQINSSRDWANAVIAKTPSNTVIFTKQADKILYPTRNVALYKILSQKEVNKGDGVKRTLALMSDLTNKNYKIYFLDEDDLKMGEPKDSYFKVLNKYGLKINSFDSELGLYEIVKI